MAWGHKIWDEFHVHKLGMDIDPLEWIKIIGYKRAFKIKIDMDDNLQLYKARLVSQNYK
jgi:hypothetical protein